MGGLFVRLLRLDPPLITKLARVLLGSDIYCPVPASLVLPHPYGIVVHPEVVLGERVVLMQQVTLGQSHPAVGGVPVVEDEAYLGAGAKILGAVRIGQGATVGANAVVTRDVPPGATVVGHNRLLEG